MLETKYVDERKYKMNFIELSKKRFTVRKFSDAVVEKEKLDKMMEAGNTAPTAKNNQPQRIYVLQSKEALDKLDTLTPCRYGAGTVLLFTYNTDEDWKNPKEEGVHSGVEDVSIVATHIMLQAAELGVDTTWINFFGNTELEKAFNLPENERSVLLMPVGYREKGTEPFPTHDQKKSLEDIVTYL